MWSLKADHRDMKKKPFGELGFPLVKAYVNLPIDGSLKVHIVP